MNIRAIGSIYATADTAPQLINLLSVVGSWQPCIPYHYLKVAIHKSDLGRVTWLVSFSALKTSQSPCFGESTACEFVEVIADLLCKPMPKK